MAVEGGPSILFPGGRQVQRYATAVRGYSRCHNLVYDWLLLPSGKEKLRFESLGLPYALFTFCMSVNSKNMYNQ